MAKVSLSRGITKLDVFQFETASKRVLCLIVTLFVSLNIFAQTDSSNYNFVSIPLERYQGYGKISGTFKYFQKKNIVELDEFGQKINGVIYRNDYQPIQKHYRDFLAGKIDKAAFDKYFSFYKADSADLCASYFKSDIEVKLLFGKDGFVTIVADQDNDGSFNNEIHYRHSIKRNPGDTGVETFQPVFKFENINYYRKGSFLKRSAIIGINLYYDHRSGSIIDSIKPTEITFKSFEYRLGRLSLDSIVYNIHVNRVVFDFLQQPSQTNLLVVDANAAIPANYGYLNRRLANTFLLDGYILIPDSVSMYGDTLFARVSRKKANQVFGFYEGASLPNFRAQAINGRMIDIYKHRGSGYLLIDFFGSWCGPCIANFPKLKKLSDRFSGKGLTIIGIASEQDTAYASLKKLLAKEKLPWEVIAQAKGTNNEIMNMSGIHLFPTYLLISPDNKVIYECGGGSDFEELGKILERELKRK